jgi:hypothetical protein
MAILSIIAIALQGITSTPLGGVLVALLQQTLMMAPLPIVIVFVLSAIALATTAHTRAMLHRLHNAGVRKVGTKPLLIRTAATPAQLALTKTG